MVSLYDHLIDPTEPGSARGLGFELVYGYTDRDGLLKYLLPSRSLRMNSWSLMNDPRETKRWELAGTWNTSGALGRNDVPTRVDQLLRRSARLLSASRDRAPQDAATSSFLFHRGWAKAPLWHFYGDAHRGACLVLDFSELNAELAGMPMSSSRRWRGMGSVEYEDRPARVELSGSFATVRDVDDAVDEYLNHQGAIVELHLQKTTDWSYENEARIICVDFDLPATEFDQPLDGLPIGQALKAVILGDAHDDPSGSAQSIRKHLGSGMAVMRCSWADGRPRLEVL